MYYITDSRFEAKGARAGSLAEAEQLLEADIRYLREAGALVRPFEDTRPDSPVRKGYEVRLDHDVFELMIQVIN